MSSDPAVAPLDSQTNEVVETAAVSAFETEGSEATSTAASANGDALPEQKGTSEASEKATDVISESKGDAELAEGKGIAEGAEAETPIEKLVVPTEMTFKETPARAWVVLVATFTAQLFTWGFLFAGGIWQRFFYTTEYFGQSTQAELAWIGSIAYTVCMVMGMFVGRIADVFGHQMVFIVGVFLYAVGFLAASFATQVWQLYLTHGVIWGLSVACIYIPASGISVTHWTHKIAFALSITGMGSGIGGFVWPNALQAMLDAVGPRWAYRIMAAMGFVVLSACAIVIKPKVIPVKKGKVKFFDLSMFKSNKHYWLLSMVAFWLTLGYYVPTYYLAQNATDLGIPSTTGSLLIAVMNGSALLMRLVQAPLVKVVGSNTCFSVFIILGALCQLLIWPFANDLATLMVFAILYGFFATGGCFGFFPIVVAETFLAHYASALGLIFVWCAPGGLIGPVVSGILFDNYSTYDSDGVRTTNYLPMQMWGGIMLFVSGLFAVAEMLAHRKKKMTKLALQPEAKKKFWVPV